MSSPGPQFGRHCPSKLVVLEMQQRQIQAAADSICWLAPSVPISAVRLQVVNYQEPVALLISQQAMTSCFQVTMFTGCKWCCSATQPCRLQLHQSTVSDVDVAPPRCHCSPRSSGSGPLKPSPDKCSWHTRLGVFSGAAHHMLPCCSISNQALPVGLCPARTTLWTPAAMIACIQVHSTATQLWHVLKV